MNPFAHGAVLCLCAATLIVSLFEFRLAFTMAIITIAVLTSSIRDAP